MACLLPSPIATIVITAATPITMPSTERKVLILFLSNALKAIRKRAKEVMQGKVEILSIPPQMEAIH
jgi:hypothetical protein